MSISLRSLTFCFRSSKILLTSSSVVSLENLGKYSLPSSSVFRSSFNECSFMMLPHSILCGGSGKSILLWLCLLLHNHDIRINIILIFLRWKGISTHVPPLPLLRLDSNESLQSCKGTGMLCGRPLILHDSLSGHTLSEESPRVQRRQYALPRAHSSGSGISTVLGHQSRAVPCRKGEFSRPPHPLLRARRSF